MQDIQHFFRGQHCKRGGRRRRRNLASLGRFAEIRLFAPPPLLQLLCLRAEVQFKKKSPGLLPWKRYENAKKCAQKTAEVHFAQTLRPIFLCKLNHANTHRCPLHAHIMLHHSPSSFVPYMKRSLSLSFLAAHNNDDSGDGR